MELLVGVGCSGTHETRRGDETTWAEEHTDRRNTCRRRWRTGVLTKAQPAQNGTWHGYPLHGYPLPRIASQNSRCWLPVKRKAEHLSAEETREDMRQTLSQSSGKGVMATQMVDGLGGVYLPVFARSGIKTESKEFVAMMREQLLPQIQARHGIGTPVCLFMDNAPSHSAKSTQKQLKASHSHGRVMDLTVMEQFPKRLRQCILADGWWFEGAPKSSESHDEGLDYF